MKEKENFKNQFCESKGRKIALGNEKEQAI